MVARSEIIDRAADDYMAANCLMLIKKVEGEKKGLVFRCKTCLKEFSSFQALGGHRASHTKPISNSNEHSKKVKPMMLHLCPICGVEFHMGQALGGHMRKHRNEKLKASDALVTQSFFPDTPTTNDKTVACLDLRLDHEDSFINLELELGIGSFYHTR